MTQLIIKLDKQDVEKLLQDLPKEARIEIANGTYKNIVRDMYDRLLKENKAKVIQELNEAFDRKIKSQFDVEQIKTGWYGKTKEVIKIPADIERQIVTRVNAHITASIKDIIENIDLQDLIAEASKRLNDRIQNMLLDSTRQARNYAHQMAKRIAQMDLPKE